MPASGAVSPDGGDLLLVGSGGFGRETAEAVRAINDHGSATWRLLGFIDDDPARHRLVIDGTTVIGGRDLIHQLSDARVVVCTGRPSNYVSRMRIVRELDLPTGRYATIIHPSAAISSSSSVGPGSVLLAQVTLTAAVRVGAHASIMPQVTLTHDDVIDDFVTIATGVSLGGGVRVHQAAYIGAGTLVRENLQIGAYSLVGMGAVVTHDVPPLEVWAGIPARYLRAAEIPDKLNEDQET